MIYLIYLDDLDDDLSDLSDVWRLPPERNTPARETNSRRPPEQAKYARVPGT